MLRRRWRRLVLGLSLEPNVGGCKFSCTNYSMFQLSRWARPARPLARQLAVARGYASAQTYFDLFPQSFPRGGPPADDFSVSARQLRREYRSLQSEHHPDVAGSGDGSVYINRAYTTVRNPFSRAAYVVQLHHPEHLDMTLDEVSKAIIARYEHTLNYKTLLMTVLEAHEALELAGSEADLADLAAANSERIAATEATLTALLKQDPVPWDDVVIEAIRMKYWVNIDNGIREWEPGKPVHLTH